jgi:hypothetical protein
MQHGKISNFEGIDVYAFGHLLFEMSMGFPLQESVARQITDCPESLSMTNNSMSPHQIGFIYFFLFQ